MLLHVSHLALLSWLSPMQWTTPLRTHTTMSQPWYVRYAYATQRMISIHSVGWASHSGAHPGGFQMHNPPLPSQLPSNQPQQQTFCCSDSRRRAKASPNHPPRASRPLVGLVLLTQLSDVGRRQGPLSINVVRFQRPNPGLISTRKRWSHSRAPNRLQGGFGPGFSHSY